MGMNGPRCTICDNVVTPGVRNYPDLCATCNYEIDKAMRGYPRIEKENTEEETDV